MKILAALLGFTTATTWAACPGATESTEAGSKVTCQPVGGVELKVTFDTGAVPELVTINVSRRISPTGPLRFRRWSAVDNSSLAVPATSAPRSILPVAPLAPVTVTVIGYCPALTEGGAVALTLTLAVPPPSIDTVLARASASGEAVTVQPSGPLPAKLND